MTMAVSYVLIDDPASSSSTLKETRTAYDSSSPASVVFLARDSASWLGLAQRRLAESAQHSPAADYATVNRAGKFLQSLPSWIREPFVAVGDAGIVDLEWESTIGDLTLSFSSDGDFASWLGENGEEWEIPLKEGSQLVSKLAVVSLSE